MFDFESPSKSRSFVAEFFVLVPGFARMKELSRSTSKEKIK